VLQTCYIEKAVLITGASGTLGTELIKQLSKTPSYKIYALTSKKKVLLSYFSGINNLICFDREDWENGRIPWNKIDVLIHCAFAIISDGEKLVDSLNFTREIFEAAQRGGVLAIINISSRNVYGSKYKPLWKETTPICPDNIYAMAKYSSELLLKSIANKKQSVNFTNIRLSSLLANTLDMRIVNKFVKDAIDNQIIKITGGKQIFSYLDIRDAASGIISLLSVDPEGWNEVYNLGSDKRYDILEISKIISDVAKDYMGKNVIIELEEKDIVLDIGMDSSLFYKETGWMPKYSMRDTVVSLFEDKIQEKK
jgi:nucleoside-diphosphate-sugar epimerase